VLSNSDDTPRLAQAALWGLKRIYPPVSPIRRPGDLALGGRGHRKGLGDEAGADVAGIYGAVVGTIQGLPLMKSRCGSSSIGTVALER